MTVMPASKFAVTAGHAARRREVPVSVRLSGDPRVAEMYRDVYLGYGNPLFPLTPRQIRALLDKAGDGAAQSAARRFPAI